MIRRRVRSSLPKMLLLAITALGFALVLNGCGSGSEGEAGASGEGDNGETTAYVDPEYAGLPADLTPEEVCDLLEEATVTEHLNAEVNQVKPGTSRPDCQWYYKLPGGPATTLQVQVMSMEQTGDRLGSEALEWGLGQAPPDTEISKVEALDTPNGSYEIFSSTVIFAIDPAGRLLTVSAHSETAEEGRVALTEAVLSSLAADHA